MTIENLHAFIVLCLFAAVMLMLVGPWLDVWFRAHPPQSAPSLAGWLLLLLAGCVATGLWLAIAIGFGWLKGVFGGALFSGYLIVQVIEQKPWLHFRRRIGD